MFDKIHQETLGKSGCRRIVSGQYLGIDPKGRAVMVGACEKQKLVYVLIRDTSVSQPQEQLYRKNEEINQQKKFS